MPPQAYDMSAGGGEEIGPWCAEAVALLGGQRARREQHEEEEPDQERADQAERQREVRGTNRDSQFPPKP